MPRVFNLLRPRKSMQALATHKPLSNDTIQMTLCYMNVQGYSAEQYFAALFAKKVISRKA
jgi:hypothetical protein